MSDPAVEPDPKSSPGDSIADLVEQIRGAAEKDGASSALGARVVVRKVRRGLYRVEREGRR